MPSEATLLSVRDELKGRVFRGINGFIAKYFKDKSWSATIANKINDAESSRVVDKLSSDVSNITDSGALGEWLHAFQCLFSGADQAGFRFRISSQPANAPNSPYTRTIIYLETSDVEAVAGSTRLLGVFRHGGAPAAAEEEEDDDDFLRLCVLARRVFQSQPTRRFLHAFLARNMTLELWVFDRAGAYSSRTVDLAKSPHLLMHALAGYAMMSDEESGFNTFVKRFGPGPDSYVTFDDIQNFHLRPDVIVTPECLVGLGTTCYAASVSTTGEPSIVVKFSWRVDEVPAEPLLLERARERNVWGVTQLRGHKNSASIADHRQGLHFPQPFVNGTFSCVATAPLGVPIQNFTSIRELLEVLGDLVKALRSLYVDGRMLHRDISIKNLVINTSQSSADSPKGLLSNFDLALDLEDVRAVEPMVGSDGFRAIGILSGHPHTYRHDLESLFYVFLWFAIGNDHEHDNVHDILEGLPKTSRLWKWCSMDFPSVGQAKAADMSPEGFPGVLEEFSADFAPLRGLAKELHTLLFPVHDGKIFTGTDAEQKGVERLYDGMADAFNRSALEFQR